MGTQQQQQQPTSSALTQAGGGFSRHQSTRIEMTELLKKDTRVIVKYNKPSNGCSTYKPPQTGSIKFKVLIKILSFPHRKPAGEKTQKKQKKRKKEDGWENNDRNV